MTDLALQIAGSKLAISVVLGGAVWLTARGNERPQLSHALCLTLLAVLLIPPLVAMPVLTPAAPAPSPAEAVAFRAVHGVGPIDAAGESAFARYGGFGLVLAWILGAVAMVGWTVARARGFRNSLRRASRGACPALHRMAREIGHTLGLKTVPTIETTDAVVSPMVYWGGGTARVLIPSVLLEGMERSQLRWILAHELAHVRRRDHLIRWLEWMACTVFWWNPIAWWARRRLRAAGEVCCDALVVDALGCTPRAYARALVRAIDLIRTERTPPMSAFASAADSGHRTRLLEGRLRMIVTRQPVTTLPPLLRPGLRCGLVVLLTLGLVYCSQQAAPAALEAPPMDESFGDASTPDDRGSGRGLVHDADAGRLGWSPSSALVVRAEEISWTNETSPSAGGEDKPRSRLVVVVDYDDEVEGPLSENDSFRAVAAERAEGFSDTGVLIIQRTEGRGWRFPDRIPEISVGPYYITTFGPEPLGG